MYYENAKHAQDVKQLELSILPNSITFFKTVSPI